MQDLDTRLALELAETTERAATRRPARRRGGGRAHLAIIAAGMLTLGGVPLATAQDAPLRAAAAGDTMQLGEGNSAAAETRLLSSVSGRYALRTSNTTKGANAGGGLIAGCRTDTGTPAKGAACVRAVNFAKGPALEAQSMFGDAVASFTSGDPAKVTAAVAPFSTNAAKRVDNLNADKLDGKDASDFLGKNDVAGAAKDSAKLGGLGRSDFITKAEHVPIRARASFGQLVTLYQVGPIKVEMECREDVSGMNDQVRMLAWSQQDGAFMDGDSNHTGPGNGSDYLGPDTQADARQVSDGLTSVPGQPALEFDIDTAFVAGPNGEYIGIDETWAFGLNVYGADCFMMGYLTVLPAG